MRYTKREKSDVRFQSRRAAVFVDYENLHSLLSDRLQGREHPDEYIAELLDELRAHLYREDQTQTNLVLAYADFTELNRSGHFVQRSLCRQGAEPRFVPSTLQPNAAEIQLCVEAVDLLHSRPDVGTLVLVTGDRAYLPLVQQFKRYGRRALVVALEPPASLQDQAHAEGDVFLDAAGLFSDASRRELLMSVAGSHRRNGRRAEARAVAPQAYHDVTDEASLRTLEVIDEHFGQYDEVYLTPLLRKLSETFDNNHYDPKSVISLLERAGAVSLEKRRGFPYDYTVLIVNAGHPDVSRVQQSFYDEDVRDGEDDYDYGAEADYDDYEDDSYPDDASANGEREMYTESRDDED